MSHKTLWILIGTITFLSVVALVLFALYLRSFNELNGYNEIFWVQDIDLENVEDGHYSSSLSVGDIKADVTLIVKNHNISGLKILEE